MLAAMFEGLATYEEVKELIDALTGILNDAKKELGDKYDGLAEQSAQDIDGILGRLKDLEKSLEKKASSSEAATKKELNKVISIIKKDLRRLRDMIPEMPESFDPTSLQAQIDALETRLTVNYTAEEIRNMLELLDGEERLKASAIDGIEELVAEILKAQGEGRQVRVGSAGGGRGFFVFIDGVKKGIIKELNFAAGTGMSIAYTIANGRPTLTFNASGGGAGGITVETPPETPDAVITEFTVSDEPQWIVADGTTYFAGAGYSYNSGTGKITTDVPPSASIRVII